ncbi:MAG TPA: hypothetical protein VEB87_06215 [Nitrososphaerales archaeon]|nr:hypothetical protein [Nitrososphaerales archaeon]
MGAAPSDSLVIEVNSSRPMIRGKKVRLRAFEEEDYEFMHRIQTMKR